MMLNMHYKVEWANPSVINNNENLQFIFKEKQVTDVGSGAHASLNIVKNSLDLANEMGNGSYICELIQSIKIGLNNGLTKREIEVSSLWLSGYSAKESAKALGIVARTIGEYRSRTMDKLKVRDKKGLYNLVVDKNILHIYFKLARILATKPTS